MALENEPLLEGVISYPRTRIANHDQAQEFATLSDHMQWLTMFYGMIGFVPNIPHEAKEELRQALLRLLTLQQYTKGDLFLLNHYGVNYDGNWMDPFLHTYKPFQALCNEGYDQHDAARLFYEQNPEAHPGKLTRELMPVDILRSPALRRSFLALFGLEMGPVQCMEQEYPPERLLTIRTGDVTRRHHTLEFNPLTLALPENRAEELSNHFNSEYEQQLGDSEMLLMGDWLKMLVQIFSQVLQPLAQENPMAGAITGQAPNSLSLLLGQSIMSEFAQLALIFQEDLNSVLYFVLKQWRFTSAKREKNFKKEREEYAQQATREANRFPNRQSEADTSAD